MKRPFQLKPTGIDNNKKLIFSKKNIFVILSTFFLKKFNFVLALTSLNRTFPLSADFYTENYWWKVHFFANPALNTE